MKQSCPTTANSLVIPDATGIGMRGKLGTPVAGSPRLVGRTEELFEPLDRYDQSFAKCSCARSGNALTLKIIALRILDVIFVAFSTILVLWVAGLPMGWLSDLVDMSSRGFQGFVMSAVVATSMLVHAIATSDSAP